MDKIKEMANNRPKEWRYGQAIFNYAYKIFPTEVNKLRASEYDCFYRDDKVDLFLKELKNLLNG